MRKRLIRWMAGLVLCAAASAAADEASPPSAVASSPSSEEGGVDRADIGRSQYGGAGLSHSRSAFILTDTLSVSAMVGYFRQQALTASAGVDEYHLTLIGAAYAPLPWLELSATFRSATLEQPASAVPNAYLVGDLFFRGKVGTTFLDHSLALAAEVSARLPPPVGLGQPFLSGISPQVGGLFSYDFSHGGPPIRFHLNSGLTIDNSVSFDDAQGNPTRRFALAINTYNQWNSVAGLEARFRAGQVVIVPFAEYALDVPLGAPGGFKNYPMRAIPGVRVMPWRGLFLDASVELGLTRGRIDGVNPVPDYMVLASIGYQPSLAPPREHVVERVIARKPLVEAPSRGTVSGQVADAATLKPVPNATVALPSHRLLTDADGKFQDELPMGPFTAKVEAAGYKPTQASGTVTASSQVRLNLMLDALPPPPEPMVTMKGTVVGDNDKPLAATVQVLGFGAPHTAEANGQYGIAAPGGEFTLEVSAPGYLKQAKPFNVKGGQTVIADFVLKEKPKTLLVVLKAEKIEIKKQVHFATASDVILPDSAALLDQVASLILDNSRLKLIRIEGHTDNQGDADYNLRLSENRAAAVMRALIDRGVEAARLHSEGFGKTKPIAENRTSKGRAANRRVEFMIEQQD